ncbi:MAG TPA: sensor histidine kinase [Ohtaekwangia sp.]|nr:sensor histidine kinase [Ohtaekwangia sp.]
MKFLLTIICLSCCVRLFAQPVVLTDEGRVDVQGAVQYWRDVRGKLDINAAQSIQFIPHDTDRAPSFGFDESVYWFKLEVHNRSSIEDWLLDVTFAPLDIVELYEQDDSSQWIRHESGDHFAVTAREIEHRHPVFVCDIPANASKTYYLRIKTNSSVQLPITFWERERFFKTYFNIEVFNGLFYGAMLIMILYQLFLFFSIRDKITFYYVLALLAMTNAVALFQGYTYLYLFPSMTWLNDIDTIFTAPLFIVFSGLLTRAFLNLRHFSPLLDRLVLVNMILDVAAALIMVIFYPSIPFVYHHYFVLIHCALTLTSAGYCLYSRYKPARYYLMAWITILLATALFAISNLGFAPGYLSTNYTGLMIGCVLQMLFITFALGDRWNQMARENEHAKELELQMRERERERLEVEVKLRTLEIQNKSERLEEVNRVKDKLFSLVSHDIKGPLGSLRLALSMMKAGQVTQEEFQTLSTALEARFGQTTEFVENLLQWATLQLKGETFEPVTVSLRSLAEEAVNLLELDIRRKDIKIRNNIPPSFTAFADPNMVKSVVRNLLTNAVKFTSAKGSVEFNAWKNGQQVIISVADTGVGIPPAHRNRLFTLDSITTAGTKQEKGTGLGLVLCKEFVEKNGGRIWFDTEEGRGTTFYFSLPEEGQCELPSASQA